MYRARRKHSESVVSRARRVAGCNPIDREAHKMTYRTAKYTDDTPVQEGDKIRFKQAPGGILPASDEWVYGTAEKFPYLPDFRARMLAYSERMNGETLLDPDELYLRTVVTNWQGVERTEHRHIVSHIVERA